MLRYQRRAATRALGAYGTPSPRSSAIIPLSANSEFSVIGLASIQLRHLSVRIAHQTGIQPSLKFSRIALSLAQTPSLGSSANARSSVISTIRDTVATGRKPHRVLSV